MKTKNTLIELLQHQLKLAEAGESFEDKFEFRSRFNGEWLTYTGRCPDFTDGDDWRIVDQDKEFDRLTINYDEMLKTLKLIASRDWHYTSDVVDIAKKTVEKITGVNYDNNRRPTR